MTENKVDQNKAKAVELAEKVRILRARRSDPATPKPERKLIKLQIDTLTWLMVRLDPARYGQRFKAHRSKDPIASIIRGMIHG